MAGSRDIQTREVNCAKCGFKMSIPSFNISTIAILCEGCFSDRQPLQIDWEKIKPKKPKTKKRRR